MSNRTFNVTLKDGKSYELMFDNRALYEFEGVHGTTVTELMSSGKIGFQAVSHLVYAGLLHSDDSPTLPEVIDMIPPQKLVKIVDVLVKALGDALDFEEGDEPVKKAKASQAG